MCLSGDYAAGSKQVGGVTKQNTGISIVYIGGMILGAFANLRQVTLSFVMSVKSFYPGQNTSVSTGGILMKFYIADFY